LLAAVYKQHLSKSAATAMRFTSDDKHLIKCMWVSTTNYGAKHLLKMLSDRRWSLDGLKTLIKKSVQDI